MNPILVLGSRIRHGRPDAVLEQRLLKALEITGPGQLVIVSGSGESGPMKRFLEEHGLDNVVEETCATSTNENLEFARRLVPRAGELVVVTSNFHALRTRLWAWHLKIPVRVVTSPTPRAAKPRNYGREIAATAHSALRIAYRRFLHWLGRP